MIIDYLVYKLSSVLLSIIIFIGLISTLLCMVLSFKILYSCMYCSSLMFLAFILLETSVPPFFMGDLKTGSRVGQVRLEVKYVVPLCTIFLMKKKSEMLWYTASIAAHSLTSTSLHYINRLIGSLHPF